MTYQLREIDLTRHVRTPAGVAYFHKPIGSPIGGGSIGPRLKPALAFEHAASTALEPRAHRAKAPRAEAAPKLRPKSTSQPPITNAPTGGGRFSFPGATFSALPGKTIQEKNQNARAARAQKTVMEALREKQSDPVMANLWQLDNIRLQKAIDDPNTPPDRKRAMKVEKAQRVAMVQNLMKDKASIIKDPEYKDAIKSADKAKIANVMEKHHKGLGKLFQRVTKPVKKLKNADHAQSVADGFWDLVVKALGGALTVALLHFGIGISI